MLKNKFKLITLVILISLNVFLWREIEAKNNLKSGFYFLDVGQGDSELVIFQNGIKVLTDAGPDKKVSSAISKIIGIADNYIDIGVITHPQLDHYNGFNELLTHYNFGVMVMNGREPDLPSREWDSLIAKIKKKKTRIIFLGANDKIKIGSDSISILSPDTKLLFSKDLNDTALTELIDLNSIRALFTADMGQIAEKKLLNQKTILKADILKVAHHGSKYSSTDAFLKAVDPSLAVIEVGEKNRYKLPAPQTIEKLKGLAIEVFRTDIFGNIQVSSDQKNLLVSSDKQP